MRNSIATLPSLVLCACLALLGATNLSAASTIEQPESNCQRCAEAAKQAHLASLKKQLKEAEAVVAHYALIKKILSEEEQKKQAEAVKLVEKLKAQIAKLTKKAEAK